MKEIFLETDFSKPLTSPDLYLIKSKLESNNWFIVTLQINSDVQVTIFESENEYEWEEFLCKETGNSFEQAFLKCLIKIQNYIKKL